MSDVAAQFTLSPAEVRLAGRMIWRQVFPPLWHVGAQVHSVLQGLAYAALGGGVLYVLSLITDTTGWIGLMIVLAVGFGMMLFTRAVTRPDTRMAMARMVDVPIRVRLSPGGVHHEVWGIKVDIPWEAVDAVAHDKGLIVFIVGVQGFVLPVHALHDGAAPVLDQVAAWRGTGA
ncbi:hypothetical protein [uncultured Tateyamaria sp.]|uniref:hypothetical protein n=1 Tax=Tateyamaria sp. TaxID=1929288 RepID=UPI002606A051|nr:hypothetical protein [uncultured Tateyamaria sp.]